MAELNTSREHTDHRHQQQEKEEHVEQYSGDRAHDGSPSSLEE